MKSFLCFTLLLAGAFTVPAQTIPPAPVPEGAGAAAGVPPPPSAAEPSAPVDPAVPDELKHYGLDRYDGIIKKSPFHFKIIKALEAPTISFAADLSLAGFTIDAGKHIKYASLVDKKKNLRFVINDQAPNKDGIQLVQLNRGETLLATTVLARKGAEDREIKADEQIVKRPAVVSGPGRGDPHAPGGPVQQPPKKQRKVILPPPVRTQ